jgi:hypothetical protein
VPQVVVGFGERLEAKFGGTALGAARCFHRLLAPDTRLLTPDARPLAPDKRPFAPREGVGQAATSVVGRPLAPDCRSAGWRRGPRCTPSGSQSARPTVSRHDRPGPGAQTDCVGAGARGRALSLLNGLQMASMVLGGPSTTGRKCWRRFVRSARTPSGSQCGKGADALIPSRRIPPVIGRRSPR